MEDLAPELERDKKKKKALFISGVITAVLFFGWIVFFVNDSKKELEQTASSRIAIFGALEENIGTAIGNLKSELGKIGNNYFNVGGVEE